MKKKVKCYIAAGWFNPQQEADLTKIEEILEARSWVEVASPRKIFICPPNASKDVQDSTFVGNLEHIKTSDFVIMSSLGKDAGALFEVGYSYANNVPIVYICVGLPEGAKFNLMLSRSGRKVCTTYEQLEDYLDRSRVAGQLLDEPYADSIE